MKKIKKSTRHEIAIWTSRGSIDEHYDHRGLRVARVLGSNGANVAMAIPYMADLTGVRVSTALHGFVGSDCGARFRAEVSGRHLVCHMQDRPGATRVNQSHWQLPGTDEEIKKGHDGWSAGPLEMAAGYNVVNGLPRGSTFVLSGSGPQWNQPGLTLAQTHQITGTWYAQMGAAAKARDLMFIVDVPSSGDIAVPGTLEVMFDTMNTLGVVPFAAKLNGVEASALAGRPVTSLDDKLEVAETRLKGSFFICGGNGGVLVRDPNGRAWHASVPKPSQTFSTIGSGDRTLAAFWCAIMAGKSTEEAALHAAAARMAGRAVMPGMCNAEIVREFMLHGKVKRYA